MRVDVLAELAENPATEYKKNVIIHKFTPWAALPPLAHDLWLHILEFLPHNRLGRP